MPLRNVALGQNHIIALHATNRDLSLVEVDLALLAALFRYRDCKHSGSHTRSRVKAA